VADTISHLSAALFYILENDRKGEVKAGLVRLNGKRTGRLVDRDAVEGPATGIPRTGVVVWNEKTGGLTVLPDFR
jgi:hypothetical protein